MRYTPEQIRLMYEAGEHRRFQIDFVGSALLKIEMMGLSLEDGIKECMPPARIHPFRWKAMISHCFINGIPE